VVHDPRVTIVHDDARHFLLTTRETFDVITSDPVHPWVRGSAALYSRDYFELVKRHLNPGGAVSQWVPLYQATEPTIRGEIATFAAAFPFTSVWANDERGQGYDVVLLGTPGPTRIDLDRTAARLADPAYAGVASSLASVGFGSLPALLATYVTRSSDLAPWLAGAPIDRDWQPWLQYRAGLESYTEQEADIEAKMSAYRAFPEDLFTGSPAAKQAVKDAGAEGITSP
jgi:spermidine synthase